MGPLEWMVGCGKISKWIGAWGWWPESSRAFGGMKYSEE
jgi:hypothetical protein